GSWARAPCDPSRMTKGTAVAMAPTRRGLPSRLFVARILSPFRGVIPGRREGESDSPDALLSSIQSSAVVLIWIKSAMNRGHRSVRDDKSLAGLSVHLVPSWFTPHAGTNKSGALDVAAL